MDQSNDIALKRKHFLNDLRHTTRLSIKFILILLSQEQLFVDIELDYAQQGL